jgi:AcrR family transcriptional regulator
MDIQSLPARERILLTAHDLFYRDGIRATGVDRLIAESGVAKLTFYRHFASKDDLIRAFLDHRHARWMAWFVSALGRHGGALGGGLLPLLAAMEEWFTGPDFRGCAFINAVAEVAGALPDVAAIAQRHKLDMEAVIADLLPQGPGGLQGPQRQAVAHAAAVAVDGAIVQAQIGAEAGGAKQALDGLEMLLKGLASRP